MLTVSLSIDCQINGSRILNDFQVKPEERPGSTDEECCEEKFCKDYKCSDPTKRTPECSSILGLIQGVDRFSRY